MLRIFSKINKNFIIIYLGSLTIANQNAKNLEKHF